MSKKTKGVFFNGTRNMAIAKEITLMYGGIFSFSLIIISLFMTLHITVIQQHNIRKELIYTIDRVEAYIQEGGKLDSEKLRELLYNKYVEVCVYNQQEDAYYFSHFGEGASLMQDSMFDLEQYNGHLIKDGKPIKPGEGIFEDSELSVQKEHIGNRTEYMLEAENEQRMMLMSSTIQTRNGAFDIRVFKLLDMNPGFFRGFVVKLAVIDMICIFCAFLIGRYISHRMLQPVEAIRFAAERITIEDLSQRIDTEGPDDEMKELTVTFNSMIDRLESSFQRQNQFVSDASHELRTPISVIQGYANLINRWGKSDPVILQEAIDSILSETEHMSALIRKLLFLAKGDQNLMQVQKTQVSLNEIVGEAIKELEILGVEREVVFDQQNESEIWADFDLIKQLLWIYLENALKYTKEGDTITLSVWKDKKYAYFSVGDSGVGIPEKDLNKIFDRFYRVDPSRNKGIFGTGLGLSIAKWIMESHNGQITVNSTKGEGTTFTNAFLLKCTSKK